MQKKRKTLSKKKEKYQHAKKPLQLLENFNQLQEKKESKIF